MSTAYMFFRRDALEAVGLMDEEYFIYSDETDLQYRLQQGGWAITYLPDLNTGPLRGGVSIPGDAGGWYTAATCFSFTSTVANFKPYFCVSSSAWYAWSSCPTGISSGCFPRHAPECKK